MLRKSEFQTVVSLSSPTGTHIQAAVNAVVSHVATNTSYHVENDNLIILYLIHSHCKPLDKGVMWPTIGRGHLKTQQEFKQAGMNNEGTSSFCVFEDRTATLK